MSDKLGKMKAKKSPSTPEQKSLKHCAENFLSSSYCFEIKSNKSQD